jgi:hypothetical protein
LFLGGVAVSAVAQLVNYILAIIPAKPRPLWRTFALALGLGGLGLATAGAWRAAIDWSSLPTSPEGLQRGQLWNDGGIPAIAGKQK